MSKPILPIQNINIADFNYNLPDEQIARHPLEQRDSCRLLLAAPARELAVSDALEEALAVEPVIEHRRFDDITELIPRNTLLVRNNTKVINARLHFKKETGAEIEIFLLDPLFPGDYALSFQQTTTCTWKCLVGNLKRWKEGPLSAIVTLPDKRVVQITAERKEALPGNAHAICFTWTPRIPFGEVISAFGNIPIPPYLNRESEESDLTDYQTVYAASQGSVAAPTAGLHFTEELFDKLKASGKDISVADVTLHVGAGTFRPVKSETLEGHDMHSETFTVSRELVEQLIDAISSNHLVMAVGTTTVRTLESLPYIGAQLIDRSQKGIKEPEALHVDQWVPYLDETRLPDVIRCLEAIITEMNYQNTDSLTASTSILIGPGFPWQITEAMITNFHQPESTLLLLVASFLGMGENETADPDALWRRLYDEAVKKGYRFLSYGDACLFFRHASANSFCIRVPGSKSISNRALVLNALSGNRTIIENLSDSEDTRSLSRATEAIMRSATTGKPEDVYIGEGAAPFRFAYALACVTPGCQVRLFPSVRLMERLSSGEYSDMIFPNFQLFSNLPETIDPAKTSLTEEERMKAAKRKKKRNPEKEDLVFYRAADRLKLIREFQEAEEEEGHLLLPGKFFPDSSQELSALLLTGSRLPNFAISDVDSIPSFPYLLMSLLESQDFGARAGIKWNKDSEDLIISSPGELRAPEKYRVEGDWSALLNFYAFGVAAKVAPEKRPMTIISPDCPDHNESLQPDARMGILFSHILYRAENRDRGIFELTFGASPDAFPPFVAAATVAGIPFKAHGLNSLLSKESNRVEAVHREFGKLGYKLTVRTSRSHEVTMSFNGAVKDIEEENPLLDSHNDHRIAMALAATLPVTRRFRLRNPGCVAKSMPGFWKEMEKLGVSAVYDPSEDVMQLTYIYPEK